MNFKTPVQVKDPNLEDYYEVIGNRYMLVHVIGQRSKHLQEGCEPLIPGTGMKPTSQALLEFYTGKLRWEENSDADAVNAANGSDQEEDENVPDIEF